MSDELSPADREVLAALKAAALPCPFCGSRPRIAHTDHFRDVTIGCPCLSHYGVWTPRFCTSDRHAGPYDFLWQALAKWNTRDGKIAERSRQPPG
jgi:hypothetical protein